ncbi:MAG: NAD(P)-binding protein [Verrucomicrobiales bacterium]|nr:NAD(P)-binding protein [Verrucomicrobiales bacterium]
MNDSKPKLAIIGAGVSGLAAAWALKDADWEVFVFEKSRGPSGRVATRTVHGIRVDHGANYFKIDSPLLEELVLRELPNEGLIQIPGNVYLFNKESVVFKGDMRINEEIKWNYRNGISELGKRIATVSDAKIIKQTRVVGLEEISDSSWEIISEEGKKCGVFDAIIFTPPAPQVLELISESKNLPSLSDLKGLLGESKFHRQFSIIMGFDQRIGRPSDCCAMLNEDRRHPISWLGFEDAKSGRVGIGASVIVAQMSPEWSMSYYDSCEDIIYNEALAEVSKLIDVPPSGPLWKSKQRWKYAHPKVALDVDELEECSPEGWFFCGDSFVGRGRVGEAILTGFDAANRILGVE